MRSIAEQCAYQGSPDRIALPYQGRLTEVFGLMIHDASLLALPYMGGISSVNPTVKAYCEGMLTLFLDPRV